MLANYPNELALYNILGLCQQAQGKYREAVASFRKMLSIDPGIAELHFNLGVLHSQHLRCNPWRRMLASAVVQYAIAIAPYKTANLVTSPAIVARQLVSQGMHRVPFWGTSTRKPVISRAVSRQQTAKINA